MRVFGLALILALAAFSGLAAADDLERRGLMGLELRQPENGPLIIVKVLNPSLSAAQKDDQVISINGQPAPSVPAIGAILAGRKGGDPVTLKVKRGESELDVTGTVMPAPEPMLDGVKLSLSSVTLASGARVRTMLLPAKSEALKKNGLAPAVLMLGGINCSTSEVFALTDHPDVRLYRLLTKAGFAVFIIDKPGVGDSEGERCPVGGFDVEIEAYSKAAEALAASPGIDKARLFAVGLSMGGVQAPLINRAVPLRGIVTWGAAVMPWYDYLLATFRRRTVLEGVDAAAVEPMLRNWRAVLAAAFVDGLTRDEIAAKMPETLAAFEAETGSLDAIGGRSLKFQQECDKANVVAAWQAFQGQLLSLHGEFDWVSEDYDHRLASVIVNAKRPGAATFEVVPGLDHGGTQFQTLADSFGRPGEGKKSDAFNLRAADWLTQQAKS